MASENSSADWFAAWFDSPFYHKLYAHRDEDEADRFIQILIKKLKLVPGSRVLDLACGAGRHARVMHSLKMDVTAIDLSVNSIRRARALSPEAIRFEVADMRTFSLHNDYDAIFNLFTSFGYFERVEENEKVLDSVVRHLSERGLFVMDYLNAHKVMRDLVPEEQVEREGVNFHIRRECRDGFVLKHITFTGDKGVQQFTERVQLFSVQELERMLKTAGLKVLHTYGDYELNSFIKHESPRLILITQLQ